MSIQDEVEKLDTPKGQCARCGDFNPYTAIVCASCNSRLPWADAVNSQARAKATTRASFNCQR